MKRSRKLLGTLRGKFFALIVVVGLFPLIIVGISSFCISYNNLIDISIERAHSNQYIIFDNLRSVIRQTEGLARQFLSDEYFSQVLGNQKTVSAANLNLKIKNRLHNHINSNALPVSVFVFSMEGERISWATNWGEMHSYEGVPTSLYEAEWFQHAIAQKGLESYYLGNVILPEDTRSFSSTKLMRDLQTGEAHAIFVINVPVTVYHRLLPSEVNTTGAFFALVSDRTGDVCPIGEWDGRKKLNVLERRNGIANELDTRSGIRVVSVLNTDELIHANMDILLATLAISVLLIAISIPCSLLFVRSNTQSLDQIKQVVTQIESGNIVENKRFEDDEFGQIGNTILDITSTNQNLQERVVLLSMMEKEAKLRSLQFQINPHFLYNTLSSIYWLCKLGKNDEAARAAILLSDNFKYVIGHNGDCVTVRAEIDHVRHYLELQNIRFNQSIQIGWDLDDTLMEQKILRFILQPIVENALYHGLEPKVGERLLNISVHMKEGVLVFVIEDNGVGINDPQQIEMGYGMRNVNDRISLKYGKEYGCTFQSVLNEGTRVTIRVPADGDEST